MTVHRSSNVVLDASFFLQGVESVTYYFSLNVVPGALSI